MSNCIVKMFYVGQGLMNLVEVYDDSGRLSNLSLIDCGGDFQSNIVPTYANNAIDYVRSKMSERYDLTRETDNPVYLDNLFISHLDSDHWSLLLNLMGWGEESSIYGKAFEGKNKKDICYIDNDVYTILSSYTYFFKGYMYCHQCNPMKNFSISVSKKYSCLLFLQQYFDSSWNIAVSFKQREQYVKIELDFSRFLSNSNFNALLTLSQNSDEEVIVSKVVEDIRDINVVQLLMNVLAEKGYNLDDYHKGFEVLSAIIENCDYPVEYIIQSLDGGQAPTLAKLVKTTYVGGNRNALPQLVKLNTTINTISDNVIFEVPQDIWLTCGFYISVLERLSVASLESSKEKIGLAIKNNATSLVLALYCFTNDSYPKYVFPGDATAITFNSIFIRTFEPIVFNWLLNANWSAPHHGSKTCFNMGSDFDITYSDAFLHIISATNATSMVVSSGERNQYRHPTRLFIDKMIHYFNGHYPETVEGHNIYYYDGGNICWYENQTIPLFNLNQEYPVLSPPFCSPNVQEIKADKETLIGQDKGIGINVFQDVALDINQADIVSEAKKKHSDIPAPNLFFRRI